MKKILANLALSAGILTIATAGHACATDAYGIGFTNNSTAPVRVEVQDAKTGSAVTGGQQRTVNVGEYDEFCFVQGFSTYKVMQYLTASTLEHDISDADFKKNGYIEMTATQADYWKTVTTTTASKSRLSQDRKVKN